MSENQSVIRKTETVVDDIADLWRRRPVICVMVSVIVVVPTLLSVIGIPLLVSKLNKAEQAKDKAELQLSPFLAAANRSFPEVPKDERLDHLQEKINEMFTASQHADRYIIFKLQSIEQMVENIQQSAAVTPVPTQRVISQSAERQLAASLRSTKDYKLNITCVMGDNEGFALAEQIKGIFQEAGWNVAGVSHGLFSSPVRGLAMEFAEQPPSTLQRALLPLFEDLGYPKTANLNPKGTKHTVRIVVGSK